LLFRSDPAPWRPRFVLASASPRRLQLLQQIGIEPDALLPSEIDETPEAGERPRVLAERLATRKLAVAARAVRADADLKGAFVLSADTVVSIGRSVFPKAERIDEANLCLRRLSGRSHRVQTCVAVQSASGASRTRLVETKVRFKRLSNAEIEAYLASGEWRGKAGGYAVQGLAGAFVVKLVGSYTNVVGLPLYETASLLTGLGYPLHFGWTSLA
jgi:septum formation protein